MLVLSVMAGGAATVLAAGWLGERSSAAMVPVVVASRDVEAGQQIDAAMLQAVNWPRDARLQGSFAEPGELGGRVLRTALARGEPVLEAKLAPAGTRGGLSAVIEPGRRAITVKVNEVVGVAGFALPGNYVDVLLSTQDDSANAQMVSRIVLERILVLAVAQEAGRDETRPKVVSAVTLEVTPQQAERLDLARNVGQLSLVLRNQIDRSVVAGGGISKADLLRAAGSEPAARALVAAPRATVRSSTGGEPARPASPAEPTLTQVEIIRGVLKSSAAFEEGSRLHAR